MSRIDYHHGRANADFETVQLSNAMRGWKSNYGDFVDYYRLDPDATQYDDVYEEVLSGGRKYKPVIRLGCLHVSLLQGENDWDDKGFYYNDDIRALVPYEIYTGSGMPLADMDTGAYELDRIVYKQKVFRVVEINVRGQIIEHPNIVAIDATQLKPDELHEDPLLAVYGEGNLAP